MQWSQGALNFCREATARAKGAGCRIRLHCVLGSERSMEGGLPSSLNERLQILVQKLKSSQKRQSDVSHGPSHVSVTAGKGTRPSLNVGPMLVFIVRKIWKHAVIFLIALKYSRMVCDLIVPP